MGRSIDPIDLFAVVFAASALIAGWAFTAAAIDVLLPHTATQNPPDTAGYNLCIRDNKVMI